MKLIIKKTIKQVLNKPYTLAFTAPKTGFYAIFISARAKSEKQRGERIPDSDDLHLI